MTLHTLYLIHVKSVSLMQYNAMLYGNYSDII